MEIKRYVLVHANKYDIEQPEFFDAYDDAYKEMKRQYDIFSNGESGRVNHDDAWCAADDGFYNWRIFYIE